MPAGVDVDHTVDLFVGEVGDRRAEQLQSCVSDGDVDGAELFLGLGEQAVHVGGSQTSA